MIYFIIGGTITPLANSHRIICTLPGLLLQFCVHTVHVCDAPLHCACILSCATRVLWQQTRTNCSSPNLVSTTTTCLKCTGRGVYWCGKGGELWEQLRLTVSPNYGITSLYTCVVVREGLVLLPMHHHTLVCWTIVRRLVDDLKVHIY